MKQHTFDRITAVILVVAFLLTWWGILWAAGVFA